MDALCENYHVKIATVFNGRFTPYKTALNILQEKSIPVIIHEKGKRRNTYSFLQNISFEHADLIAQGISSSARSLNEAERRLLNEFCMAHQKGSATNSAVNFTEKYIDTIGEDTCDKDYVVYFTSGLEEKLSSTSDFSINSLIDDLNSVYCVCQELGKRLIIRHHPNLGALGTNRESSLLLNSVHAWSEGRAEIIEPQGSVNSYHLAEKAWGCIAPADLCI